MLDSTFRFVECSQEFAAMFTGLLKGCCFFTSVSDDHQDGSCPGSSGSVFDGCGPSQRDGDDQVGFFYNMSCIVVPQRGSRILVMPNQYGPSQRDGVNHLHSTRYTWCSRSAGHMLMAMQVSEGLPSHMVMIK
eukprot:gnl/TRDRNA2_/TRDRNA2_146927_c2_seq2.p1 gnl/TRDRNA2_/TRDRNA2_146927_c2~~gnl/TRDRNA2_/TRDRNA2_146927_c2_seq2.p1  ORF type:complete len:133 (-),score=2.40 gnl/TRDRNA2_/TRDRNA2_146927_c2_seq2:69-467(-)